MNAAPSIGRIVIFRSRTGGYDVPAIITATTETLAPAGVDAFFASEGKRGVPPLTDEAHVHLTVFTPGLPGQRANADDFLVKSQYGVGENVAGCYQEWDVPRNDLVDDPEGGDVAPGSWRWPVIR